MYTTISCSGVPITIAEDVSHIAKGSLNVAIVDAMDFIIIIFVRFVVISNAL